MYMTHICICTSSLSDLFSIPKLGNVSGLWLLYGMISMEGSWHQNGTYCNLIIHIFSHLRMGFQIVFTLNCHCHSKIILLSVAINNFKLSLVSELKGKILKRLWLKVSFFFLSEFILYSHRSQTSIFFFIIFEY